MRDLTLEDLDNYHAILMRDYDQNDLANWIINVTDSAAILKALDQDKKEQEEA